MVIKIRKQSFIFTICLVLFGAICCLVLLHFINSFKKPPNEIIAGGMLYPPPHNLGGYIPAINPDTVSSERFQRPSKSPPYPNPYTFERFRKDNEQPPLVTRIFENPEDLILAYYGILGEASSMRGYSGGCGTIGWSGLPYPYSYELLTRERQKEMPFDQYADSFIGIGYTTLLKLLPAYAPPDTPDDIKYYMAELEMITGAKAYTDSEYDQGSLFAYHYGLITVKKTSDDGWKIENICYIPEDFLCAPTHGWFYLSDVVVQIVYGNNLKLIDSIDWTEQKGDMIHVYASGDGGKYRFDFVRLTNGYDILLHEYVLDRGTWKEAGLLNDHWKDMKLTIDSCQR